MKWYRWDDELINLNKIAVIIKENNEQIYFYDSYDFEIIEKIYIIGYDNQDERDAEFEKICALLGCEKKTQSRCC